MTHFHGAAKVAQTCKQSVKQADTGYGAQHPGEPSLLNEKIAMTINVTLGDEALYLAATNEVESRSQNPALWAKSMALANGDEAKAKYIYIKLSVLMKKRESQTRDANASISKNSAPPTASTNERSSGYSTNDLIPVTIYAGEVKKHIVDIIEEIKRGALRGQCIDERWYVSAVELEAVRKVLSSRVASPPLTSMSNCSLSRALPSNTATNPAGPTNSSPLTDTKLKLEASPTHSDLGHPAKNAGSSAASPRSVESSFRRMFEGDAGLGVTYWMWGMLGGFAFYVSVAVADSSSLILLILIAAMLYHAVVLVGLYRAATKYAGAAIWSALAKIVVVFGWLFELATLSMVVAIAKNAALG